MYNEWPHYELMNGRAYAVVFRDKGNEQIKLCPFCGNVHSHPIGHSDFPSHAHCHSGRFFKEVIAPDGIVMKQSSGYIIREV